ncbi:unnamed protein product [Durusdinium trenchii]|uniref:Uncharacterized protein n=1 Tax=Durusdinium trenchii TaxID=1381693 RepID=A0ABP0QQ46_9DINO
MASLASKETAGAAMYNVALQEKEMHLLHEQLLRERSELQRTSQLCKAQAEELKRRERLNSSLWEQRVCLERDASELRARLARRAQAELQREVVWALGYVRISLRWLGHLFGVDRRLTAAGREQAEQLGEEVPLRVKKWEMIEMGMEMEWIGYGKWKDEWGKFCG